MPKLSKHALCGDDELGYVANRTQFHRGRGFALDEAYRLAHLPLVAPAHPRVIAAKAGTTYAMGRHEHVASLVLPVPPRLHESPAYLELEAELRASPFGGKIAWNIVDRRRDKLHATICGSAASGQSLLSALDATRRRQLAQAGTLSIELRGLFSGTLNHGRLYLRIYPERTAAGNGIRRIQRLMGWPETALYLVGLFNMTDDLEAREASALADLIVRWWDRPLLRFEADHLWLLGSYDDLVLDGHVIETIPLT